MKSTSERGNNPILRFLTRERDAGSAIPAIIYLVAVSAFIKNHHAVFDFPLDDAWIHRVYARALAFGHGFAYNAGQQEAGSTSPLWAVVSAPAHWLEGLGTDSVVLAVKAVGVMLGLACVLTAQRTASVLIGSRLAGRTTASLFALEPKLLFSALSGMETCLLVALLAGACLLLIENRPFLFLVLIGLAPVTRPEALLLLPCALPGLGRIWRTDRSALTRAAACLIPIVPTATWSAFCLSTTGHVFPNTFYLKARPFSLGVPELEVGMSAIAQHGLVSPWLLAAGICAFCVLCLRRGIRAAPPFLFLVVGPLVYLLGVVGSRRVILGGYYWTRWLDPASILITLAFCTGLGFVLSLALDDSRKRFGKPGLTRRSTARILISSLGFASLLASVPTFVASFANRRTQLASDSRAIAIINVQMGQWIAENTPKDAVVGVNDAGAIRYFGRRHTIDLGGLNNADIAFGKVTLREVLARTDWLAVFPRWLNELGPIGPLLDDFQPRVVITMPPEEYTISGAPSQTQKVALERTTRNRDGPGS